MRHELLKSIGLLLDNAYVQYCSSAEERGETESRNAYLLRLSEAYKAFDFYTNTLRVLEDMIHE